METKDALKQAGLSDNETDIYLACLELGTGSAQAISHKAKLPRSTSYGVLESLKQKGLISSFQKKHTTLFSADDPQNILLLARQKAHMIEHALPQLRALYGYNKTKPTARLYEGKEGMQIVLQEMLAQARHVLGICSTDDLFSAIDEFPEIRKRRLERKIPTRLILRDTELSRERKRLGPKELREVRIMPEQYEHHGAILLWSNKVALFSLKMELNVLLVESEEIVRMHKAVFDFMWGQLDA